MHQKNGNPQKMSQPFQHKEDYEGNNVKEDFNNNDS